MMKPISCRFKKS